MKKLAVVIIVSLAITGAALAQDVPMIGPGTVKTATVDELKVQLLQERVQRLQSEFLYLQERSKTVQAEYKQVQDELKALQPAPTSTPPPKSSETPKAKEGKEKK
jgi:peptidoglycan hydrolase CwlO-like protein